MKRELGFEDALEQIKEIESATIKTCETCHHRLGEECERHGGQEIYTDDTCEFWEG